MRNALSKVMWVTVVMMLGMLALAAPAAWATDFTVTNTIDSGAGSLRQAIIDANSNQGPDTIKFNIPGTGVHKIAPWDPLPPIYDPVVIDGYTQPGASANTLQEGNDAKLLIELDGTNAGRYYSEGGLRLFAPYSTVRGLVINRFGEEAILISGEGNRVKGNFIGTDATGTVDLGNSGGGVHIHEAPYNIIGGTLPEARNIISGNDYDGVLISGSDARDNVVQGNYIGTDATGTKDLGTFFSRGVRIQGAPYNTIGGISPWARNIISGNDRDGVLISGSGARGNLVQGNYIGTDATGSQDLGNSYAGVEVVGALNNTIGGTSPGARNIISGNGAVGVDIRGDLASSHVGIGNKVEGNFIGTDASGTKDLGNGFGVYIDGASDGQRIGGSQTGAHNVIAFNDRGGVVVDRYSRNNAILSNSIFSNADLGIDLDGDTNPIRFGDGVTPNDPGDADTGANDLQNFPVLSSAVLSNGTTTIEGTLESTPSSTFTVQFFSNPEKDPSGYGEGKNYLGEKGVSTDSSGKADFSFTTQNASAGEYVSTTATAITTSSNPASTSEFSNAVVVNTAPEAASQSLTSGEDEDKTITLSATDVEGDALTFEITDQPDHGALGSIGTVGCEMATKSCEADLTYTPNKDYNGSDSFTYTASDGYGGTDTATVTITVNSLNDPPTISDIADKTIVENTTTEAISFTVGDVETVAESLTLSGTSDNQTLVPDANIVFGGSGTERTVTLTPAPNQSGTATITLAVSDGSTQQATDTFVLTVQEDTTAPTLVAGSLTPAPLTVAPHNTNVSATFSEKMNPQTISTSTFKLKVYDKMKRRWLPVSAVVRLGADGKTATLDPYGASSTLLGANKRYKVIITTGAKDLAGNALAQGKVWTFRTGTT